jgi:hypothetical protein
MATVCINVRLAAVWSCLHVLLPGSDNIFSVMHDPSWDSVVFTSTAILLVIVDGVGTGVGASATHRVAKLML